MSINGKDVYEVPEIDIFPESNLNFAIIVFTTDDLHICKKHEKPTKHILSIFIINTINFK